MCLNNQDEPLEPLLFWSECFKRGGLDTYTIGEQPLSPSLRITKREYEKGLRQLATIKSARGAQKVDSYQKIEP